MNRPRQTIAASQFALAVIGSICLSWSAHSQSKQPLDVPTILPDVALLFHGKYGEESYKLTSTTDDANAITLDEISGLQMHFRVRRVPERECLFVATHDTIAGTDIQQLDFTKFDGTYQLREACGPSGTPLEKDCTYSLHFNSRPAYCEYIFASPQFDLHNIPFADGACQFYGLGAREKQFYQKYVDAFERIYKQCRRIQ